MPALQTEKGRKMNKYKNIKVMLDGKTFDSKKEAYRYMELKTLAKAGEITDLQTQVKFVLIPAQYEPYERYGKQGQRLQDGHKRVEMECSYIADFTYKDKDGKLHVEDVKGYTKGNAYSIFAIKRKLMLHVHGIKVEEV